MTDGIHVVQVAPGDAASLPLEAGSVDVSVERIDGVRTADDVEPKTDCVVVGPGLSPESTLECCRTLTDHAPAVPVIVYTATGSEELAGRTIAVGADGYVPVHGETSLETRLFERVDASGAPAPGRGVAGAAGTPADGSSRGRTTAATDAATAVADASPEIPASEWADLVVEQAPLAIIEWNLSFEAVRWNGAATELFGYDASEVLGEPAVDFLISPEDRDAVVDHWQTLVDTVQPDRKLERNVRADGTTRVCEWHNTPLVDDAGDVVGILSFAEDVTDEIRRADALEALQSTTHRLMRARSRSAVATIAIEAVTDVIDHARAGFRVLDRETNELVPEAATTAIEATIDGTRIGPGDGVLWDVFDDGESHVITDPGPDIVPFDFDVEIGETIVMPIADEGLLTVAATEETGLGEAEYYLVDVLATTAAVALERVERDRELRRAKTIVEAVGDGVYALDGDGRFTTVNDSLAVLSGYDRETLLDSHAGRLFPDPAIEDVRVASEDAVPGAIDSAPAIDGPSAGVSESIRTAEISLQTASGTSVPCEVTTTVLKTDDESIGTVGIVRDISDRKAMKRAVLAHQEKVATLHEVVGHLEDCETREEIFEEAVAAAEGVLQFDVCVASEADDTELEIRVVSDDVDKSQFRMRRPMAEGLGGKAYLEGETQRVDDVTADPNASPQDEAYRSGLTVPIGEYGVFQAISTDIAAFDERDEELAELLISHVTDALDRLTYEKQLVAERDRFAALFENVPDAVIKGSHAGSDFIVEDMNSAFEETFGYDLETLEGEPIDAYIASPERREAARDINDRSESGEVIETEVKRRTTGGIRDFMLRVVPYEVDGEAEHAFGVYTDITEQKQRQKRVEVLNRVLRHDLRNGMNIIEGSAERLASLTDDEAAETYANAVRERTDELIGLAEKTRVVERTLDRGDAVRGPVDIADTVETAIDRIAATHPDVEIERSLPIEALVRADDLLTEAVYNVLENAVVHTDRSDPSIDVSVRLLEENPQTVALTIADDGPGIPEEERQLLEEEREITQLRHASGLGLWLVDWVVTQSGGELRFAENEPRGTVVELRLPVVEVTDGADGDRSTISE